MSDDIIKLSAQAERSPRVMKVLSMFDVPPEVNGHSSIDAGPLLEHLRSGAPWKVGLIVGPSGSGKSTVAAHAFPEEYAASATEATTALPIGATLHGHPVGPSLLDEFPDGMPIAEITTLLTKVGFGSAPAWLRPRSTLSVGERFRADVALALARNASAAPVLHDAAGPLVVDEFTSTIDRRVAQIASGAIGKYVREQDNQRLVAVACHYDIEEWLQPDWVYRPDTATLTGRSVQSRPTLEFEVCEVSRDAWRLFRHHHYLSGDLHVAAKCACAFYDGEPVAFNAYYKFPHPKVQNIMKSSRTVVLPDWQGIGLGLELSSAVGAMLAEKGYRYRATLAHPALIAARRRDPRWREDKAQNKPSNSKKPKRLQKQHADPRKLLTRSFEYRRPRVS